MSARWSSRPYSFHQLSGTADLTLGDAVAQLREAGHHELAKELDTELVGRNVLPGRWTFQIVSRSPCSPNHRERVDPDGPAAPSGRALAERATLTGHKCRDAAAARAEDGYPVRADSVV